MRKNILRGFLFLVLLLIVIGGFIGAKKLPVATGFAAKNMCSCLFTAGRDQLKIQNDDLAFSVVKYTKSKVDKENKSVRSSLFGLFSRTAKYSAEHGCTLDYEGEEFAFSKMECGVAANQLNRGIKIQIPPPYDSVWNTVDKRILDKALDASFGERNSHPTKTRSVLVIKDGKLIGEKHAPGFDRDIPQLGWSMTKRLMNTWIGMLVKAGSISLDDQVNIDVWQGSERENLSYRHLLQMNSGLEWEEMYGNATDVTHMLYTEPDAYEYAMDKPLNYPIGTHWNYASGTTNILSGIMRRQLETFGISYQCFLQDSILNRIGMHSATVDKDHAGHFIMSSYGFASAMDWGKFGLFYLNDGKVDGNRLLPEGWVDWTREVAKGSEGAYGAHFWLNRGGALPDISREMYSANGFQGQRVFIFPDKNVVVVRMGNSPDGTFDFNQFLKEVMAGVG